MAAVAALPLAAIVRPAKLEQLVLVILKSPNAKVSMTLSDIFSKDKK